MTQRDLDRARMLGQSAGRNGAGPNANPWRSSPTLRHLAEMGGEWSEGRLTGVRREPDGTIRAGANPRGMQGYAVGR